MRADEEQRPEEEWSLPPPPPPISRKRNRGKKIAIAAIATVALVGTLAVAGALLADSEDPEARAGESPAATEAPSDEPSPSPVPTLQSVVEGFTNELLETGGYTLRYAVLDRSYFAAKDADLAPLVLLVWGDTPKSFTEWTILQNALRSYADDLEEQGIRSYGDGIVLKSQGQVWVFAVELDDFVHIPGPNNERYVRPVLAKPIPILNNAGEPFVEESPSEAQPVEAPEPEGKFGLAECDVNLFTAGAFPNQTSTLVGATELRNTGEVAASIEVTFK